MYLTSTSYLEYVILQIRNCLLFCLYKPVRIYQYFHPVCTMYLVYYSNIQMFNVYCNLIVKVTSLLSIVLSITIDKKMYDNINHSNLVIEDYHKHDKTVKNHLFV